MAGSEEQVAHSPDVEDTTSKEEIQNVCVKEQSKESLGDQLIKQEERETGVTAFKPYKQYFLSHRNGFLYFSLGTTFLGMFVFGQLIQNYWLAANVENSPVSRILRFIVCTSVGRMLANALLLRSFSTVALGCGASRFTISTLLTSLCRAPINFVQQTLKG